MFKGLSITTIKVTAGMIVVDPVRPEAANWRRGHRDGGGGSGSDRGCGGGCGGGNGGGDGGGRDGGGDRGEACQGGWDWCGGATNIEVLLHCSIGSADLPVAEGTILGVVKNLSFIWTADDF